MKRDDKITMTVGQLKKLVNEAREKLNEASRYDVGYVYLNKLFYKKKLENIPQRTLKRAFNEYDGESPELNDAIKKWMSTVFPLPKNRWFTAYDASKFVGVVWETSNGSRGYGLAPALKFKDYESAEAMASLLSSYGKKDSEWGFTRDWIGRTYP